MSTLTINSSLGTQSQPAPVLSPYSSKLYASSRNLVMIAMATIFLLAALVLSGLSFLPQTVLPFSGAYFVIGAFLVFIAAGILLINSLCDLFSPVCHQN